MSNAWKIKGVIFLNVIQPLLYIVLGMVFIGQVEIEDKEVVIPSPILVSPTLVGERAGFFGVANFSEVQGGLFVLENEPISIGSLFEDSEQLSYAGGYWSGNGTLQYNESMSHFALQVGLQVLATSAALFHDIEGDVSATVLQLPYTTTVFRIDLLLLPIMLALGFSGLVFSVLDVLLLRADKIIDLFRTTGITEWTTYQGIMLYKASTTFVPFFLLVIILAFALDSVIAGNGGRWLGTVLIMLGYAYSVTPLGLIMAKKFIHSDFRQAANVFPGACAEGVPMNQAFESTLTHWCSIFPSSLALYLTLVSWPFLAWNIALQELPEARNALLIVGDFLCLIPPVAFQRGIAAVIEVSTKPNDPDLSWGDVWSWKSRVWFTILMMVAVGTFEWIYLHRVSTERAAPTRVEDSQLLAPPENADDNFGVVEERERSLVDDNGINARELVKLFKIKPKKGFERKDPVFKSAVNGVSFGVRRNEIYAMVGPNGAGKSTTMASLCGEHTAESGEVSLAGKRLSPKDKRVDHLFDEGNIAYCPQFDALFVKKTVREHLYFYATVRGLDLQSEATRDHLDAIVCLLGLEQHLDKMSTDISGGYKRRTCLAIAMIGYPDVMLVDECTTGKQTLSSRYTVCTQQSHPKCIHLPKAWIPGHAT